MSHPSDTLLPALLQLAQTERDRAASALRAAEAQAAQALAQARDLHSYRSDQDQRWLARFQQTGTQAGGPELLDCHRNFGQRLDQAIGLQTSHVHQLDQRLQQARAALLAREQRVAAVRKLMGRRLAQQQQIEQRRDQRSTDEAAQRVHSHSAGQKSGQNSGQTSGQTPLNTLPG